MYADDSNENFRAKRARFRSGGTLPKHGFLPEQKKAHTIGETLIKPCAFEMVRLILVEKASRKNSRFHCTTILLECE